MGRVCEGGDVFPPHPSPTGRRAGEVSMVYKLNRNTMDPCFHRGLRRGSRCSVSIFFCRGPNSVCIFVHIDHTIDFNSVFRISIEEANVFRRVAIEPKPD